MTGGRCETQKVAHGVVNFAWLAERWGWTNAARSGAVGIGLPALAEVWITSLDKLLRHRMEPQILGVPLAIPLLWFNVIFSSITVTEAALSRLRLDEGSKRILLAPATALTATSLDLVMGCFGIDRGLWEWNIDGPYATDIKGANGRHGIPLLNFLGWLFLVGVIVLIHQSFTRRDATEDRQEPRRQTNVERLSLVTLIPYYLVSVIWTSRNANQDTCSIPLCSLCRCCWRNITDKQNSRASYQVRSNAGAFSLDGNPAMLWQIRPSERDGLPGSLYGAGEIVDDYRIV